MRNTSQTEAMRLAEFKDLEYWPAGVGLTDWVESVCAEMLRLDAALADELNNRDVLDKMLTQCITERDQLRAQVERLQCDLSKQAEAFKAEANRVLSNVQAWDREKPFNDADMFGEMVSIRLTGLLGLAEMVRPGCREAAHAKFLEEVAAIRARSNT